MNAAAQVPTLVVADDPLSSLSCCTSIDGVSLDSEVSRDRAASEIGVASPGRWTRRWTTRGIRLCRNQLDRRRKGYTKKPATAVVEDETKSTSRRGGTPGPEFQTYMQASGRLKPQTAGTSEAFHAGNRRNFGAKSPRVSSSHQALNQGFRVHLGCGVPSPQTLNCHPATVHRGLSGPEPMRKKRGGLDSHLSKRKSA